MSPRWPPNFWKRWTGILRHRLKRWGTTGRCGSGPCADGYARIDPISVGARRHFAGKPFGVAFDKEGLAAEKFRFLGVRLRQLQQTRQLQKLLITSTLPEEGKSLVSANLAATLARRKQQKVLLLEGDLRRPVLSKQFGHPHIPGVTEWLYEGAGPINSIYYLDSLGFWFLPAGRPPGTPWN